jgi:hypothetical protein
MDGMDPPIGCGGCGSAGCSRTMPGCLPGSLGRSSGVRWGVPGTGSRCGRSGVSGVVGSLGRSGCSFPGGVTSGWAGRGSGPPGLGSGCWSMGIGVFFDHRPRAGSGPRERDSLSVPRRTSSSLASVSGRSCPRRSSSRPMGMEPPGSGLLLGCLGFFGSGTRGIGGRVEMSAMPPGRRHRAMTLLIVG